MTSCHGPKELLIEPATLYVIRSNGFVGCAGKLITQGQFWGEDFILEAASLRKKVRAVALTYVEVFHMNRTNLVSILEKFPAEKLEVRLPPTA